MKLRNIITAFTSLLIPITLGIVLSNHGYKKVNAEPVENKTLYIDLSLNDKFLENAANPYIKYNNGSDVTVSLLTNNKIHIYYTEKNIPIEVFNNEEYGFEIGAFNGEYKTSWISGGDNVLKENNYNYICLDHYVQDENAKIKGYGYFGNKDVNPGATYLTQRVWLNNDNTFLDNDIDNWGYENAVGYFDDKDNYHILVMSSIINLHDNRTYYYADIPEYVSSIKFMRISKTDNGHNYLIYQNVDINYLSYGVCYFAGVTSYEDYLNITPSSVDGATAAMLHLVVEAYLTYGKSSSNGCSSLTVKNLFNTWFKNKSATKDELKNEKIPDYTGYSSNGNSYEGLTKNSYFSVNEKWNTMCSQAGIDPNTGNIRTFTLSWFDKDTTKMLLIIGGVAVIVCGGAVALMIIRRKKLS